MSKALKVAIIGGIAGGATAAARIRRLDESAHIVLFERGPVVSFATCGMPYYLGGKIKDRQSLVVTPVERMEVRYNVDIRPNTEVTRIDRGNRQVFFKKRDDNDAQEGSESYDKLIIATGSKPFLPAEFNGVQNVFTLRNMRDMERIDAALTANSNHAVVIGGGFIGLEMVENLRNRGVKKISLIELMPQVLGVMDVEMTRDITNELVKNNIEIHLGDSVTSASYDNASGQVVLNMKSGKVITSSVVIVGVGVVPESDLAAQSGLELGVKKSVKVNSFMQSNDPDIYAVGDVVETLDFITHQRIHVPLAGPSNRQARIAADHILGRPVSYRNTQGTAIVKVFGMSAALTGATEKALIANNRPYRKIYIDPPHHVSYYPGAQFLLMKVLFDPQDGTLLGAQVVGSEAVDKEIDTLSMAIQSGMTVFDLEESELAYSPLFGAAKSPINMVGFVGAGLLRGDQQHVYVEDLPKLVGEKAFLLNVLPAAAFAKDAIPDSVNIPLDELRNRLNELPKDRLIVVVCRHGQTAYNGFRILVNNGFNAKVLAGGMVAYRLFHPKPQ